jgi:ABC-type glutathione transport system ATPase component
MPKLIAHGLSANEFETHKKSTETSSTLGKGQSLKLTFSDMSAHVRLPTGEKKNIMDGVSGVAHTGQVMAVMGPTGCGKVGSTRQSIARSGLYYLKLLHSSLIS